MKPTTLGLLTLLIGCEATAPVPAESSAPPIEQRTKAAAEQDEPAATPREPDSADPRAPSLVADSPAPLCVRMCELQGQARAVGADVITRECTARCAKPPGPPAECSAFASEARDRVEAVPMQKRATKVWSELSNPAFFCGYSDPLTRGLAAAATDDSSQRATALERALDADPFGDDVCPTHADFEATATAADAIVACKIEEAAAGWQSDVDAASYLSMRAVRLRLEALSLHDGDRKILLQTLVLSTALSREK